MVGSEPGEGSSSVVDQHPSLTVDLLTHPPSGSIKSFTDQLWCLQHLWTLSLMSLFGSAAVSLPERFMAPLNQIKLDWVLHAASSFLMELIDCLSPGWRADKIKCDVTSCHVIFMNFLQTVAILDWSETGLRLYPD